MPGVVSQSGRQGGCGGEGGEGTPNPVSARLRPSTNRSRLGSITTETTGSNPKKVKLARRLACKRALSAYPAPRCLLSVVCPARGGSAVPVAPDNG